MAERFLGCLISGTSWTSLGVQTTKLEVNKASVFLGDHSHNLQANRQSSEHISSKEHFVSDILVEQLLGHQQTPRCRFNSVIVK